MKRRISSAALAILLFAPLSAAAVDLLNINTADSATLQTLNGIGPSKAQAIIDYRTQNGPFATIEDIMNVSGIGTATYNGIKDFITVGGTSAPPPVQTQSQTQTQSQNQQTQSPPPTLSTSGAPVPSLTVRIQADAKATAGAGSIFRGEAYGTEDLPITNARYLWNFGDGTTGEGAAVFHTYPYPGKYTLVLTAASGILSGSVKMILEAVSPKVRLTAESDGSLTLYNDADSELAVGYWMLRRGADSFAIPEGTLVMAGGGGRFSPALLDLPPGKAEIVYPNGSVAARESMSSRAEGITYLSASQVRSQVRTASAAVLAAKEPTEPEERIAVPVSNLAATAAGGSGFPLWGSLLGLGALLMLGVSAVLYGRLPAGVPAVTPAASLREETAALAEQFEIIDVTPVEEDDPSR